MPPSRARKRERAPLVARLGMNTEQISSICYPGSVFKRILMFQSLTQFIMYVIYTCIAYLCVNYILSVAGHHVAGTVLVGAFVGGIPAVLASKRALFEYSGPRAEQALEIVKNSVIRNGYKYKNSQMTNEIHFVSKLPWPLRWNENNVTILMHKASFEVTGPVIVMRGAHKRLINALNS